jgi:hypothetical protein
MNEGWLALLIILATIGAMIWIGLHRHIIYPERFGAGHPVGHARLVSRRPGRATPAPRRPLRAAETRPKSTATVSETVSGIATLENDAEMIALRTIAKLIAADLITETVALSTVFAVKAGSSRRYKEVQRKLKIAQAELEAIEPVGSAEPIQHR